MDNCFNKSKRLFFQFVLCNLIILVSWISVKTSELNQTAATLEFRVTLENMRLEINPAGQAEVGQLPARADFSLLPLTANAVQKPLLSQCFRNYPFTLLPNFDKETIEISITDVFSRKSEDNAEGQRVVEYSALEQTRIFLAGEDYEILLKIVEAEAGGEDEIGRMLVASVVLNRMAHERFPDSIKEVVYQNENGTYQFSPVANGRYKRARVSAETIIAVDKVLAGMDYSEGALFFASRRAADPEKMRWFDRNLTKLFSHGGHEFFKL